MNDDMKSHIIIMTIHQYLWKFVCMHATDDLGSLHNYI